VQVSSPAVISHRRDNNHRRILTVLSPPEQISRKRPLGNAFEATTRRRFTGSRPRTTRGHARQRKVERAMGIEPTRAATPKLENKRFFAMADAKCD
jgi:hypothetical protein